MNDLQCRKFFLHLPTLESERLTLRKFQGSDALDANEYMSREEVAQYLLWTPHLNLYETKGYLDYMQGNYRKGFPSDWAVVWKPTGKVIGSAGFTSVDLRAESCELGYLLSPEFWGKGVMDEAFRMVMEQAFETLGARRAVLRIVEGNIHSCQFAERNGFHYEGTARKAMPVKGEYRSILYYSMLSEEYRREK